MSSISAESVSTLLLEEPKLEEKRFMHLQSLVKVPWLAVPVSEWPPASKWLVVGKTLCTENLEITIHNQIIEVAFDNLDERLICDFGEPIPVDVGLATYFSKSKADGKGLFTKCKALDIARQNLLQQKHQEKVGNFFLLNPIREWKNYTLDYKDDGEYHLFYYEKMVKLKIGMDFVELYFKDDKAGRFAIPHRIREHYYPTHCFAFDAMWKIPANNLKEAPLQPTFTDDTFYCGKCCPAIEFVDSTAATVVSAERERCPFLLNIPYTFSQVLDKKQWTVLWDAPMASGKSHSIRELLNKNKDWKVLVISVRIALTKSFMDDFRHDGLEFTNYQDVQGYTINDNKLIIQIDSLHRIPQHKDWDLVILDESQSLTAHFSAETFTKASSVFTRFKKIILDYATRVICCDADMNKYNIERTKWFIETICKRKITYIKSSAENDFRRYIRLTPADDLAYRCVQLVEMGKKIVIVSNTKTFPKQIHLLLKNRFPNKKGLSIYNEPSHA